MGTPCTTSDRDLFAVLTEVKIGDGQKASFWESSWLQGVRPKDIAPKIFDISCKKGVTVATALRDGHWITQINIDAGLTLEHLQQFLALWEKLATVAIQPGVQDSILWKSTKDGQYSAKTAYLAQFHDLPLSSSPAAVWKAWAPPKCKFFAWLIIHNRVWTADRLQRRGWPNCDKCPLCSQVQESAAHLIFKCRFSVRIWNAVFAWLGLAIPTAPWLLFDSVKSWWDAVLSDNTLPMKALSSLLLLVGWEIWNERNARVFRSKAAPVAIVMRRIKDEVSIWATAGAKHLRNVMPRE